VAGRGPGERAPPPPPRGTGFAKRGGGGGGGGREALGGRGGGGGVGRARRCGGHFGITIRWKEGGLTGWPSSRCVCMPLKMHVLSVLCSLRVCNCVVFVQTLQLYTDLGNSAHAHGVRVQQPNRIPRGCRLGTDAHLHQPCGSSRAQHSVTLLRAPAPTARSRSCRAAPFWGRRNWRFLRHFIIRR